MIDPGPQSRRRDALFALMLLAAVLVTYSPVWNGGFLWDDGGHVTPPGLRSLEGLRRIWLEAGATQQYYPVTHSVFWIEHRLWGDATPGYHLVNLLLHAASAFLLMRLLRRLEVPGAHLAAAIFALHPVQVESVAWITELKNTLSGTLCLGAALAHLRFDRTRRLRWYALGLALFAAGLLSKSVIAPLPAALLVILWWKRGALSWKRDVLPLVPWLLLGAAAGLFTAWMERHFVGAEGREYGFTLAERGRIAGRAVWFYAWKLLWPAKLVFVYPRWNLRAGAWWQDLFPAAAVLALASLWALRRRSRGPLAAALVYGGMLFPALGFVNVYPFRYSFVADHFQYLASTSLVALFAASATAAAARAAASRAAWVPSALGGALLLALAVTSWRQSRTYRDAETLYRATIERNPECSLAYNNLGNILAGSGRTSEAIELFREAVRHWPGNAEAHNNLGVLLAGAGNPAEAIAQCEEALRLEPDYAKAHYNLGNALVSAGRGPEAIEHYRRAAELEPDAAEIQNNLANALAGAGRGPEAIEHYEKALRLQPDLAEARNNLGRSLADVGRVAEAAEQYREAIRIRPDYAKAHYNLGNALLGLGRVPEAVEEYRLALRFRPDYPEARRKLALAESPGDSAR